MKYHLAMVRMPIIKKKKKITHNECFRKYGEKRTL